MSRFKERWGQQRFTSFKTADLDQVDVTCLVTCYVCLSFRQRLYNVIPFKCETVNYIFSALQFNLIIFQASSDVLRCLRPQCHMTCHTLCLARSFLRNTSDQLLPIDGQCPGCETHLLWGDLIRFKLGCYRNLAEVDNHHTHLSFLIFVIQYFHSCALSSVSWYFFMSLCMLFLQLFFGQPLLLLPVTSSLNPLELSQMFVNMSESSTV